MRKITYLICLLLLLSLLFTGCNTFAETQPKVPEETPINTPAETPAEMLPYEEDGIFVTTSDAMDYEIQNAKFKTIPDGVGVTSPSSIKITDFCGEFNGVCVVDLLIPGAVYMDAITHEIIEGYVFVYSSSDKLDVYNSADGQFYTLETAYENGLLTLDDIKIVYEKYVKANARLYEFNDFGELIGPKYHHICIKADGYWYVDGVNTYVKAGADPGEG